jgi:hypothetical protein
MKIRLIQPSVTETGAWAELGNNSHGELIDHFLLLVSFSILDGFLTNLSQVENIGFPFCPRGLDFMSEKS